MNDDLVFKVFIHVSKNKFAISAMKHDTSEKIYEYELLIENNLNEFDFEKLQKFLDNNILKLEKNLKQFIKEVTLILETESFLNVQLSVKNNNNGKILTLEDLSYSLNEAKDQCEKTLENKKIIHMLINNFKINNNDYSKLPRDLICNNYSLDINFICLPLNYVRKIEDTINKYQISLNRLISMKYIENYFSSENLPLNEMAQKIIDCYNLNEVVLTSKKVKNKSFFEKFFHFFN